MSERQRKTVQFSQRYVIDDEAMDADKKKSAVTDGLQIDEGEMKELYRSLDLKRGKLDKLLLQEVTGIKLGQNNGDDLEDLSNGNDGDIKDILAPKLAISSDKETKIQVKGFD